MYTTKNGIHRYNASAPPPVVCEPSHFVKKVRTRDTGSGVWSFARRGWKWRMRAHRGGDR
jgi:hypothetical protein